MFNCTGYRVSNLYDGIRVVPSALLFSKKKIEDSFTRYTNTLSNLLFECLIKPNTEGLPEGVKKELENNLAFFMNDKTLKKGKKFEVFNYFFGGKTL
jgi:hypothetical protein